VTKKDAFRNYEAAIKQKWPGDTQNGVPFMREKFNFGMRRLWRYRAGAQL
jgi:hypothetical protein